MRLARALLHVEVVARKLDEMTREAQEGATRARELRTRLEEATATVDDLVVEARSTLKRTKEFLEREGFRAKKSPAKGGGSSANDDRADAKKSDARPPATTVARRSRS